MPKALKINTGTAASVLKSLLAKDPIAKRPADRMVKEQPNVRP